jgi:hypothetical protein
MPETLAAAAVAEHLQLQEAKEETADLGAVAEEADLEPTPMQEEQEASVPVMELQEP